MWCYANEISLATVIGSTGYMLGTGLGFLVPIFIVKSPVVHKIEVMNSSDQYHEDKEILRSQLTALYSMTSGISAFVLITMILLYRNDPETPPSVAERKRSIHVASRRQSQLPSQSPSKMKRFCYDLKVFLVEIKSIFRNGNWRLLLGSYTLINGCIEAFQIEAVFMIRNILNGSPDQVNLKVSIILTALWISKLFSSWIAGFIADRFHNFKKIGLGKHFIKLTNVYFEKT